ncbi:unnamed protein product [Sympodiomycopsis kandeliae]
MAAATAAIAPSSSRVHFPSNTFAEANHGAAGPSTPSSPHKRSAREGPSSKSSKSSLSTAGPSTPKIASRPLQTTNCSSTSLVESQSGSAQSSPRKRLASIVRKREAETLAGSAGGHKGIEQRPSSSKSNHSLSNYTRLAQASLSTPELHLASDPLVDTGDAEHRLLIVPQQERRKMRAGSSPKGKHLPLCRSDQDRTQSSEALPLSGEPPYSSLGAVLGSAQGHAFPTVGKTSNPSTQATTAVPDRKRTELVEDMPAASESGTVIMRDFHLNCSPPSSLSPLTTSNVEQEHLIREENGPSKTRNSASSNWFQRARKWSAASRSKDNPSSFGDKSNRLNVSSNLSSSSTHTTSEPPRLSMSSSVYSSESEPSTVEDGSLFSDSALNSSITQATDPTSDSSIVTGDSDAAFLERLRSARTYLIHELSKLSLDEMGDDRDRVASLAWYVREREAGSRGIEVDSAREMLEFWNSISSGVLLCLLANRLKPGAIERIDRRDVEWVKADNLSRFLRAARDFFGVRSKDLFHPLDLADATVEGLDRAVGTILAVQRSAKNQGMSVRSPSSPVTSEALERVHSKRRSLVISPPRTPEALTIELLADSSFQGETSPSSSPSRKGSKGGKAQMLTIQQHRQAAENKLVRAVSPTPLTGDAHIRSRRRRSSDASGNLLPGARSKAPSITFAEGSFPSRNTSEEESRLPYRDRKMSESAISLTGVAEEETEDLITSSSPPMSPETDASAPASPSLVGLGRARAASPLARTSSQRRISQEIALAQTPRALRGSFDGAEELRIPGLSSGSPVRHSPARRHSARASNGLSALNPSRDVVVNQEEQPTTPKVPFPRSQAAADAAQSKRGSLTVSISEANGISASSSSPFSGYQLSTSSNGTSNPIPARPAFRHMRYTSELHLPVTQRSHSGSEDSRGSASPSLASVQPIAIRPRTRVESDVGSLYSTSPNGIQSTEDLAQFPRISRDKVPQMATSRHKLVLTTEDGKVITYQMGNCIGRGQFGSVYRALNLNSGQMVAVKRIKLEGRSEEEVTQLMHEVDLLKRLAHPSVVKYEGLVRGKEVISIILEYVENGSLLHTLKAFGEFPEKLVASYVVKILEGLNYLHESEVVHCDLKAANILTTKNGNVKLSDFGVSLNLQAMERVQKNDAVGTPNWMAPEVIELKGASTSADIWSLGCTIIELLTGKPPYGDMLAMSAMFRIVEDDRPPIPEKCSESLRDFLTQCFHKDPTKRPTAEALFEHEWLRKTWTGHKELRPQDSVPFLRRISLDSRRVDVRALHAAVHEVAEPTEIPSGARPSFGDMRSFSDPSGEGWNVGNSTERNESDVLGSSPLEMTGSLSPPDGIAPAVSGASQQQRSQIPSLDPSMLDLNANCAHDATPEEEAKPHSFVKSTFSKAVRCRICADNVRKHAVLCEDCGLICHASCARDASTPCNIQAQLHMLQRKATVSSPKDESPSASNTGTANGPPDSAPNSGLSSPGLLPISFRFPFTKLKRTSKGSFERFPTFEAQNDDETAAESDKTPGEPKVSEAFKAAAANKDGSTERGGRIRRISLMNVGRLKARSPAPSPAVEIPSVAGRGLPSRRGSSVSYGSTSGSSSVSSASHVAAAMENTASTGSASGKQQFANVAGAKKGGPYNHRVTQSTSVAIMSTPHVNKTSKGVLDPIGRRYSSTHAGQEEESHQRQGKVIFTSQKADYFNQHSNDDSKDTAQLTNSGADVKKRVRKTSLNTNKKVKDECTVM